ncbi:uncharacterized protein LOC142231939 [Haematobia irritans]|uniref:uncharacterized protein LOC142231939 n=1 Tax=Haematobia irritans TaxID=7368 RepID=UPI003F5027C3
METDFMEDIRHRDREIKKQFNDLEQLLQATLNLICKQNSPSRDSIEMQMKISLLAIGEDSLILLYNEVWKKLIEFDIKVLELQSNSNASCERDVLNILSMQYHYKNFLECKLGDVLSFLKRRNLHFTKAYFGIPTVFTHNFNIFNF